MKTNKLLMDITPIETYTVNGYHVLVKREDLACLPPGPPFAKVRGLVSELQEIKKMRINTVGYMDTAISMGGWGVAYFAQKLGMKAVIFRPRYSSLKYNQAFQEKKWKECDADIIDIEKPNLQKINFHRAKKILDDYYPNSVMLPLGLPFESTVWAVSDQIKNNDDMSPFKGTIISCLGSGTMMAGILRGVSDLNLSPRCIGIMVAPKVNAVLRKTVIARSMLVEGDVWFHRLTATFEVIDYEYEYLEAENCECPFPCNPWYDRKAWKWLIDNIEVLKQPVLFWNIGA